jgi:hypothetical protein
VNPDDVALPASCPWCAKRLNRHHGAARPGTPTAGDVGLCWGCHRAFVFVDETGRTRRPTEAEAVEIDADPEVSLARAAIRDTDYPDEAVAFSRSVLGSDDR